MKQTNVSVIIPVWNPGPNISRCVESLRGQTLKDIEMIFVDDCGTDGAMEVVRQAAAEDLRIRIITNRENVGPGVSRNVGIEAARGEYLSFVDADDYVDSFFLERLYAKAVAGQLDIVKGRFCYVKEDGTRTDHPELNDEIRKGIQLGKPLFCLFSYQHKSALYRRAFVMDNAIRYGVSRRSQDTTFLLKACHRAECFDLEESVEYYFSERNDSLMHDKNPHTLERMLHAFQEQMDYIVENMADEDDVSRFVILQVNYNLRLYNYLSKKEECRNAADSFIIGLREQLLRFPRLDKLKSESFVAQVLCDYGDALSHRPFKLPWEEFMVENYVETIQEWVDFVKMHSECSNAAVTDLRRLYLEAEALCTKNNSRLPRSLVHDVKKIFRKNNLKQAIRNFVAKIPVAKPLYNAIKNRYEEIRRQHLVESRRKQPIIRQGSLECFEGFPLKVHWELTEAYNYRCSYCFNMNKGYKSVFCSLAEAKAAIKHLAMANRPSYQVSLLGGEPTLHPHLLEIMDLLSDYLGKRLEKISIITNGTFNDKTIESILMVTTKTCIEVKVSMHFEFLKMEKIKEIIERMSKDVNLVFLVMLHPRMFDKVIAVVDELCRLRHNYPFGLEIKLIRDLNKESHFEELYTSEHYKWAEEVRVRFNEIALKTNLDGPVVPREAGWEFLLEGRVDGKMITEKNISTDELVKKTNCRFLGLFCCVGTNVIDIKPNGITRGLVCKLAKEEFNIYKENPFREDGIIKAIQCTKERCSSSIDWRVPKFKSASEAEEFIKMNQTKQQQLIGTSPLYDAAI